MRAYQHEAVNRQRDDLLRTNGAHGEAGCLRGHMEEKDEGKARHETHIHCPGSLCVAGCGLQPCRRNPHTGSGGNGVS